MECFFVLGLNVVILVFFWYDIYVIEVFVLVKGVDVVEVENDY